MRIQGSICGTYSYTFFLTDPFRCERAYDGNTIGQANGVTGDKGLDLRECNLSKASFTEVNFAGAVMFDANFSEANLEAVSWEECAEVFTRVRA